MKQGFQFASPLQDYDIYHDKVVMINMLLQTLSTLFLQNFSYYFSLWPLPLIFLIPPYSNFIFGVFLFLECSIYFIPLVNHL